MDKAYKKELVSDFKAIFDQAQAGILIDYKGLTVEELTALRKNLFSEESNLRVIKNTLAKIAAEGTPCEVLADQFVETRAFVYSNSNPVSPAKLIAKEAKNNEKIKLIAGILNSEGTGKLLDIEGIKELGSLPSKEVLIAKLLFILNAPITNFARVLNEIPASLVRVLQAAADSKSKS